jgi:hypothetical protein
MATEHPQHPSPGWLNALERRRKQTAYGLLGLGALLIVVAFVLISQYHWDAVVEILACFGLGLLSLVGGYVHLPKEGERAATDSSASRRLVLVMGGALGFFLLFIALGRAVIWANYFTGGTETWQGEGSWRVWLCVFLALAGLGIMFGSLMLARTEERSNVLLRRSLYGYNAVLTGLLLLALLAIVNIMTYVYVPKVWDWTNAGLYTLSSQSVSLLQHLEKPLKVYALLSERSGQLADDLHNLMDNCQSVSSKVQVEYLSRDRNLERLRDLIRSYGLIESEGLLVVYGTGSDEQHQFVRVQDLWEASASPRGAADAGGLVFKGEEALMSAVRQLEEGKAKAVIYFTQGNGELDINDSSVKGIDQGAGLLRDRLQKAGYDVKGLLFSAVEGGKAPNPNSTVSRKVPDDADAVVIASPHTRLADESITALRDYMKPADPKKKKGKLVVLLDVNIRDGQMVQTGLESFLTEFNVDVGNNRVLNLRSPNPLQVLVVANSGLRSTNNLAAAFTGVAIPMYDVRTVRPRPSGVPTGGTSFQAEPLLLVPVGLDAWAEDNLRVEPTQYVADMIEHHQKELAAKLSAESIPVAVAVTESTRPANPNDPHAFMNPSSDQKPRMVVFGDATFACNAAVRQGSLMGADFLASSLAWLRERPEAIGIPPKKRGEYQMKPDANVGRMVSLPFVLMSCGVIGLGLGVWVVRRR